MPWVCLESDVTRKGGLHKGGGSWDSAEDGEENPRRFEQGSYAERERKKTLVLFRCLHSAGKLALSYRHY